MRNIVFATRNRHKLDEVKGFFDAVMPKQVNLLSLDDIGFEGEIIENDDTFEGNARIKAQTVCKVCDCPVIADDSGLEVDALGGRPGVLSARYAGPDADDEDNNMLLLSELEGIPESGRTARFVSVICMYDKDGTVIESRGECEGIILHNKRGKCEFGYDPLFYYPPLKKTFAELETEEKNKVSHRGNALSSFILKAKEYLEPSC